MGKHILLIALAAAASIQAQPPAQPRKPAWEQRDALGRIVPWTDEFKGQRLSLQLPRTRLLFGQPMEVRLASAQAQDKPPYLRVHFDGPQKSATIEFTTDKGETVPFVRRDGGGGAGVFGTVNEFRLNPTGKFSRNGNLIPGNYRLRVVIDAKADRADGNAWTGKINSNTVDFTVLPTTADGRKDLAPAALRQKAAPLLAALDAADAKKRESAEAHLEGLGFDIHPLLEETLANGTPAQVEAATRVLRKITELKGHAEPAFIGLNFGPFTEHAWKALIDRGDAIERLRVEAAIFGPVPFEPEAKLSPEAARKLIAQISDASPHVRVAAARAVPLDAGDDVLKALVSLLGDSYSAYRRIGPGDPAPESMIADEVRRNVLPRFGKSAIAPVVDWLRKKEIDRTTSYSIPVLGDLGPDQRSVAYLKEVLAVGEHNSTLTALKVLGQFGKDGVPLLMESAKNQKFNAILRRVAIEELAHAGDAKTAGPLLLDMLKSDESQLAGAAIQGIDRLKIREALPELYRLARDEKTEQNVRSWAIGASARMGERADVEKLMLELLASPKSSARGNAAFQLARVAGRDAVPKLLESLSDKDWYVRAMTDNALKSVAQKPEGVGYDPAKPNPQVWQEYWKQRK
jgi:HEAT repeat protein